MVVLIKQAKIIFPKSKFHNKTKDILIRNGVIEKIGSSIKEEKAKVIKSKNLHVSLGWMDIGAQCGEPGFEYRESLETLSQCAMAGGYTGLAIFPNTYPVIDNKSSIQYILNSSESHLVNYYPIGALSKKCQGEEITEMMDMSSQGAVAFSDGTKPVASNGLLLRALEYVKSIGGLIINSPKDTTLSNDSDIHEGEVSTSLGLKANPSISEFLTLERDIRLTQYADSKLLAHQISTKESVHILKTCKDKNIYSSVAYLNLCKTEDAVSQFDVNSKVNPPLRAIEDQEALVKGVTGGTIDIITSNHIPLEEEAKKKEFVYADGGAIGLQTCYSGVSTFASQISLNKLIAALSINPRKILGLDIPQIEVGELANITLFDPDKKWTFDMSKNKSKSKNSPFIDTEFTGMVIGVINGKKVYFN